MSYDNVKLWFAKDSDEKIITINEINEENKHNTYACPMCGSNLTPKAIKSKQVTSHFAHVDKSKCNSETMMHWWFKHKFLEKGDSFTVISDKERNYICDEILVEQEYIVGENKYRPDVTILTECGNTIYFEMAFSNKKKVKDYLDLWLELKNIVVEVDIKQLMTEDKTPKFKALFYNGKCFNAKRNDTYYNTIGKYKEEKLKGEVNKKLKERINKLDWFWEDVLRYKNGEVDVDYLKGVISFMHIKEKYIVLSILKKLNCIDLKDTCDDLQKELKKHEEIDNRCYFESPMNKDHIIKKAITKLNREYKKIDKGFKISLLREANKYKTHRYFRGRKIGEWRVSSYYYRVIMEHTLNDFWNVVSFDITNRIVNIEDIGEVYNHLNTSLSNFELEIQCKSCVNKFKLSKDEITFYNSKGFDLPRRCKTCRDKRKQNK